jgi:hypothetical protein
MLYQILFVPVLSTWPLYSSVKKIGWWTVPYPIDGLLHVNGELI